MKKFFFFAAALTMTVAASAQQLDKVQAVKAQAYQQKAVKMENRAFLEKGQAPVAKVADDATMPDTVHYALPKNAFHQGFDPQGYSYNGSYIIASIEDSLIFENGSAQHNNYDYGWMINGEMVSTSDKIILWEPNSAQISAGLYPAVPVLINENNDSYQFGSNDADGTYIWASPQDYVGMTKIDLEDETFGAYGWSGNGSDYFMGTGMWGDVTGNGKVDTLDTYVVLFGTPNATMAIDTISLFFWSHQQNPLPATGNGLFVVLFDENGNNLGSYNATASDIAWIEQGQGSFYFGQVSFPISANITGKVEAYITGFNNPGVSIGCFTDDHKLGEDYQPTYFVLGDYLYTFGNNIAMFFNAKFGNAPQGIENNEAGVKATKAVVDGKIVINKGGKQYNVLGAQF